MPFSQSPLPPANACIAFKLQFSTTNEIMAEKFKCLQCFYFQTEHEKQAFISWRKCLNDALQAGHIWHCNSSRFVSSGKYRTFGVIWKQPIKCELMVRITCWTFCCSSFQFLVTLMICSSCFYTHISVHIHVQGLSHTMYLLSSLFSLSNSGCPARRLTGCCRHVSLANSFFLIYCLVGIVAKASASRVEDPGFKSRLHQDFSRVKSYQWQTLALQCLPCKASGVTGSVLGLVGLVSVYCDWVR